MHNEFQIERFLGESTTLIPKMSTVGWSFKKCNKKAEFRLKRRLTSRLINFESNRRFGHLVAIFSNSDKPDRFPEWNYPHIERFSMIVERILEIQNPELYLNIFYLDQIKTRFESGLVLDKIRFCFEIKKIKVNCFVTSFKPTKMINPYRQTFGEWLWGFSGNFFQKKIRLTSRLLSSILNY